MTTAFRPLYDRLALKPMETVSDSVLVIPDDLQEDSQRGEVVAHGLGKLLADGSRVPLAVDSGKVLVAKYAGQKVRIEDELHLIVREDDLLGIFDDAGKFVPLFNQVVIRPLPEEDMAFGILIPENLRRTGLYSDKGVVVACGAGYKHRYRYKNKEFRVNGAQGAVDEPMPIPIEKHPLEVKPGDVVIYAHRGGEDHRFEGETFRVIPEDHIEAVIEE